MGTQWESLLSTSPEFSKLPLDKNPNVIDLNGKVLPSGSPFGPVELWREVGRKWTSTPIMKKLQEIYPDPPLVLFVSNNEHRKLQWKDAEGSLRYLALYGKGKDDAFKRKVIGDGFIERYRALQEGMREGLTAKSWKDKAVFIGYEAFGGSAFARWGGWIEYSLYTPGRIEPWPLAWDGASVPFYTHNWDGSTDFTVWSPQIQSMNWVFMLQEAYRLNHIFWFELSTWDGHELSQVNDKRNYYAKLGQAYNPERYGGMVQFGMWLLRPRAVREFRGWARDCRRRRARFPLNCRRGGCRAQQRNSSKVLAQRSLGRQYGTSRTLSGRCPRGIPECGAVVSVGCRRKSNKLLESQYPTVGFCLLLSSLGSPGTRVANICSFPIEEDGQSYSQSFRLRPCRIGCDTGRLLLSCNRERQGS